MEVSVRARAVRDGPSNAVRRSPLLTYNDVIIERMVERPSKWVVLAVFRDGGRRYWGGTFSERPWTIARGSAVRYETEDAARFEAYRLKDIYRRVSNVAVEEIVNPRARF
jgi:hypothetical protein